MDDQQRLRYSRHLLLNEFGEQAQERLLGAHALVVGAGGLGSAALLYLASSGLGRITICDGDRVDLTNLQRQVIHRHDSIGKPKAASAAATLAAINPEIRVEALEERAGPERLAELVRAADVVLDCTDNFSTRHALNRACVAFRRPLVSGAGIRFDGQVAVFDLRRDEAPCYHCLFAEDARATEERCATMGVFAPLVGIIGTFQAMEAIKLLTGIGETLAGRLLLFDALSSRWHEVRLVRDPHCRVCGAGIARTPRRMDMRTTPALISCTLLALGLALAPADAAAQTLYKLIDKNGKVTYSEKPPKDFDGKVIRLDIDPNANTATLPKPGAARPETESEKVIRRREPAGGDRVESARERAEAARKALQAAIDNPRDGELQWIGKVGGGARPVQSEDYQKRIATLEENVKKAEEELRSAEQNR